MPHRQDSAFFTVAIVTSYNMRKLFKLLNGKSKSILIDEAWSLILNLNHDVNDYEAHVSSDPIIIGDFCWIGANAVVLPGVKLGQHVVVAAGAVVTKSFLQDNVLLAGVPAVVVKKLTPYKGTS